MGPPQAEEALREALALGADEAILLCDRAFAGSDTWATALTLAEAIRAVEDDFDLILVGKQAIDGDTAQVGPELAEILGIPQIMYGVGVELTDNKKKIRVKRGWRFRQRSVSPSSSRSTVNKKKLLCFL